MSLCHRLVLICFLLHDFFMTRTSCFLILSKAPASPQSLGRLSLQASKRTSEGFVEVYRTDGEKTHQIFYRVARPMSLSSRQAAPIIVLHGGPSLPSSYLYPLEDVVPYRSIVFFDQLGCGRSDKPIESSLYSIDNSVQDLKVLLRKLGIRRFHLYGHSYGGILAFEYMKHIVENDNNKDEVECLSVVLSSVPTNIQQVETEIDRLVKILSLSNKDEKDVEDLFFKNHQCRLSETPQPLIDAYTNAGTVWAGLSVISEYEANPPSEEASRMPSALITRGEFDFVSDSCIQAWKGAFNTNFLRFKTLEGCSHHALQEQGTIYGEIVDSYFSEYD